MTDRHGRFHLPIVVTMVVFAALVGAYLELGTAYPLDDGRRWAVLRVFPKQWQAELFAPFATIEEPLRGVHVETIGEQRLRETLVESMFRGTVRSLE